MDDADAKRLVDFAAGLVFATRGTIERVTNVAPTDFDPAVIDLVRAKVPNEDLREIRNCLTLGNARDRQQTDLVARARAG